MISSDFARRGVLIMWLGAVGLIVYKEFANPNNPGSPLPRPYKLIPTSIGYTGLGLLAELVPTIAFLVAVGLTVGEVVRQDNPAVNIFQQLAQSVTKETNAARAA